MPAVDKAKQKEQPEQGIFGHAVFCVSLVVVVIAALFFKEHIVSAGLEETVPEERDELFDSLPIKEEPKRPLPPRQIPTPAPAKKHSKKDKKNPFALEIPRVTLEELARNKTLLTGQHAFVLTDMVRQKWKASNWTLGILKNKIPFEWVDYYPENMKSTGKKPFLIPLGDAVPQFKERTGVPKYMQMRISLRGWKRLRKDLTPMPEPPMFWSDDTWLRHCMIGKDGKPDEDAISNFYTTNQWKFLLIGEKGTQMFFHKDHTAASSWQAMVVGRKKWTLCPNTESPYLEAGMDTWNPDYAQYPQFAKARCGQTVVAPGELVYYPAYWWHHPVNLDTPSIAYTGALVGTEIEYSSPRTLGGETKAHKKFYDDVMFKCSKCWTKGKKERLCEDISLRWPGAAPPMSRKVCEEYLPKCYKLWDEHARYMKSSLVDSSTNDIGIFD